uniref:Coiled-coil and C2 domain-containing protein 1B n=1 Tax=Tetraodon nigroviridis TaxID=99883 RepID=H3DBJ8_TETNG
SKRKPAQPRGQGAAAAQQMGLYLELDPEQMVMEGNLDDPDLEAELAAITGNKAGAGGKAKPKRKSPLPMEDIAKMADECLRDIDEDEDDGNIEDDQDLLAELQEVVGVDEDDEDAAGTSSSPSPAETPESPPSQVQPTPLSCSPVKPQGAKTPSAAPAGLQHTLEERISMYQTALQNSKAAGEASKVRRYDRGLKTLQTMLTAAKKGRPVNEAEMPPPVATGAQGPDGGSAAPRRPAPPIPSPPPAPSAAPSPEEPAEEPAGQPQTAEDQAKKTALRETQKEYRMAALSAKKQGDLEQARLYLMASKTIDAAIQAVEKGEDVRLGSLPPLPGQGGSAALQRSSSGQSVPAGQPAAEAPGQSRLLNVPPAAAFPAAPASPGNVLEALEQRRAKYAEASSQAKASGDERKARMHQRISQQYQSAIRAHKAGKAVNFQELPTPPGFPPIPGQSNTGGEHGLVAALVAADKLTAADAGETAAGTDEEESQSAEPGEPIKPPDASGGVQSRKTTPSPSSSSSPEQAVSAGQLSPTAAAQLELLEGRRKQYMRAALQAKQKQDVEQAKALLRTAKSLEPLIQAVHAGTAVDTSTVPSPPGDEDEDFILVHHSDVQLSDKAEQVYAQLMKILREQYEKCRTHSEQFTHLGSVAETTNRFEQMAESCKKSLEVLKLAQSRGLPPPKHTFEERSFHTVRIFPELSSTDMVVIIVKGMNLPAPSGIQPNDLDAYVKFDFPYPSTEQPQKHRTSVIKNTNCPVEYNQSFTLSINRSHRGFRRVVASRGLKLELLHKGGFLRSDKPIGTAVVKLDKLETQSEIREIVEVMNGRKPTGGRVEVKVRLREPLSGQDMQTSRERWLVISHSQV